MNKAQEAVLMAESKGYSEQVLYWLTVAEAVEIVGDEIYLTFPNESGAIHVFADGTHRTITTN